MVAAEPFPGELGREPEAVGGLGFRFGYKRFSARLVWP